MKLSEVSAEWACVEFTFEGTSISWRQWKEGGLWTPAECGGNLCSVSYLQQDHFSHLIFLSSNFIFSKIVIIIIERLNDICR